MITILITGANGQLGRCFREKSVYSAQFRFIFVGSAELDIRNRKSLHAFFEREKPDWCINCAAYTAVDKAESEPGLARKINASAVGALAQICAKFDARLVHFSTDYVYHGPQNRPIVEGTKTNPQSVYAKTKLAGEKAALKAHPSAMIIRTSWVYSPYGHNFAKTMVRLGREKGRLNVVFDQIGTPTYGPDLAETVLKIVEQAESDPALKSKTGGIWHYSNEGVASWYDFAAAIFELKGIKCAVNPILSTEYPTPAVRPPFSLLDKAKIKNTFALNIPYWRTSLAECLENIE